MMITMHRLSKVDKENQSAICSVCGPVRIRVRPNNRSAQCWTKRTEERRKYRPKKKPHDPIKARVSWLKGYGLTLLDYEELIVKQGNRCAICSNVFTKTAHVDHDHNTGRVRGLLCLGCNTGLGNFKDNPDYLNAAYAYLN